MNQSAQGQSMVACVSIRPRTACCHNAENLTARRFHALDLARQVDVSPDPPVVAAPHPAHGLTTLSDSLTLPWGYLWSQPGRAQSQTFVEDVGTSLRIQAIALRMGSLALLAARSSGRWPRGCGSGKPVAAGGVVQGISPGARRCVDRGGKHTASHLRQPCGGTVTNAPPWYSAAGSLRSMTGWRASTAARNTSEESCGR